MPYPRSPKSPFWKAGALSCRRGWATIAAGLALLSLLFGSGCSGRVGPPLALGEPGTSIYVVSHGWHTGIVMRRADIPAGVWPESGDFPEAKYLEVGWGDWDFYQTPEPGIWITFKAGALPTASVLHVAGFAKPVADYFAYNEIAELKVSNGSAARLARFIGQTHRRDGAARATALGPGLYGDSRFYPARGIFHMFNNCNTWTARALASAGLPVRTFPAISADGLMDDVRKLGEQLPQAGADRRARPASLTQPAILSRR